MKPQVYPSKVKFINTLLNHNFNNEVLDIHFKKKSYSLCNVIITEKATNKIYEARFGAFKELSVIVGELRIDDKNFIISIPEGDIRYANVISVPATYFIIYLEKLFVGITDNVDIN